MLHTVCECNYNMIWKFPIAKNKMASFVRCRRRRRVGKLWKKNFADFEKKNFLEIIVDAIRWREKKWNCELDEIILQIRVLDGRWPMMMLKKKKKLEFLPFSFVSIENNSHTK